MIKFEESPGSGGPPEIPLIMSYNVPHMGDPQEVTHPMASKLFGNSSNAKFSGKGRASAPSTEKPAPSGKTKKRSRLKPLKVTLIVVLVLEALYCVAIFSNIPFIVSLRNMYIRTAMSTMSHQWLATAFIPKDIIDEVVQQTQKARDEQMGLNSTWEGVPKPTDSPAPSTPDVDPEDNTSPNAPEVTQEQLDFFELYWELDQETMLDYVEKHPDVVKNGWNNIYINEAGLDDDGTSIRTTMDEQVLAIDVPNKLLLVRVSGTTYRGVLAIAKDPAQLRLCMSEGVGSYGQHVGTIAKNNGGVLAITASGFEDPNGGGNGGALAGDCISEGTAYYGRVPLGWGYKRIELWDDNRLYIMDATDRFSSRATDASEFWPALIVDGKNALGNDHIFTEMNPRACLGQSSREEMLLLVIEGRMLTSAGADAEDCAEILLRHDGYQAMNLDGGTSAVMWYDGEYITRCSNSNLDEGRYVPNAWVYGNYE